MSQARRHIRNLCYLLLATAGITGLKTTYDHVKDNYLSPDTAFISVAYIEDLTPHLDEGDSLYALGRSRIVTDDLSKIVFLCGAIDKDGIRNVSVTFNGVELIKDPSSNNPKQVGFKHIGSLDPGLANSPGEYPIELKVTDQKDYSMVESAVIVLRKERYGHEI